MERILIDDIDINNAKFLMFFKEELLDNEFFTYFNKRSINIIKKQNISIIAKNNDGNILGYGHIEKDAQTNWLGIYVSRNYRGKGLSKILMKELIKKSRDLNFKQINLSVKKENKIAINLYEKLNFIKYDDKDDSYYYKLIL